MQKFSCPAFTNGAEKRYDESMARMKTGISPLRSSGYLDGQLLIAMPSMTDPRFHRAVVYMCAHSSEGAMGLVINQRAPHITLRKLLDQLEIAAENGRSEPQYGLMAVHAGGPVETSRGFVLHSSDYFAADSTLPINENVCLTATVDILKAIAKGSGPNKAILALGYAGWAPGQLEREIQSNGWLNCPADFETVFDSDLEGKYVRALHLLGVDPSRLVGMAGHA